MPTAMSSYAAISSDSSSLLSSLHLYQVNLNNFEHELEVESDIHQRDKRWRVIEEKLRQILSLREQIYQIRYSSLEQESIKESLKTLLNELSEKERELSHLQEKDRKRFFESLQLDEIEMKEPSEKNRPKTLQSKSSSNLSYEFAMTHDYTPPEEVKPKTQPTKARNTWKKLINGASVATKFMRIQSHGQKERVHRIQNYLHKDPYRHENGKTLTKSELRDRIDEVRALIRELKVIKNETTQEKLMISKLSKKLREMNEVYAEMVLQSQDLSSDISVGAF